MAEQTTIDELRSADTQCQVSPAALFIRYIRIMGTPKVWLLNETVHNYLYWLHLTDRWMSDWVPETKVFLGIPIEIRSHKEQPLSLSVKEIVQRSLDYGPYRPKVDTTACHMDYVL